MNLIIGFLVATLCSLSSASFAQAKTINVKPGDFIQTAIENAKDGDRIEIAPGFYEQNLYLLGKSISLVGTGPGVVIQGEGRGPVIMINSGEGYNTLLERLIVRGGSSQEGGGGVLVVDSCPTLKHLTVIGNESYVRGAGIYFAGKDSPSCIKDGVQQVPKLLNSIIVKNNSLNIESIDANAIEIKDCSPVISNSTIIFNESNGILVKGDSNAVIKNNIIALNEPKQRSMKASILTEDLSSESRPDFKNNLTTYSMKGPFSYSNNSFENLDELNEAYRKSKIELGILGGEEPHPDYL